VTIALSISGSAYALPCGDAVRGDGAQPGRVACRCGDTVVSDTVLRADDPVATGRCPLDGLTVRAAREAESIRLDLSGLTIRGSGVGVGIRVAYGGTDGAWLIGAAAGAHGRITGFGVGLSSSWREALARAERLELTNNAHEGARLAVAGTILEDVIADDNGKDGLSVHGQGGRLSGVRTSRNGENGIKLFADNASVEAVAVDNGRSGIIVDGEGNDVSGTEAGGNRRDGVVVRAEGDTPSIARSVANGRDDLRVNRRRKESVP